MQLALLVLELQRDALDGKTPVVDLLRKAYIVAVKLNLDKFKEWITLEQNGYAGTGKKPPEYRRVGTILYSHNPLYGSNPVVIKNAKVAEMFSSLPINAPISEIAAHVAKPTESHVALALSEPLRKMVMQLMRPQSEPFLYVAHASYCRIIEAVRDAIVHWSAELEQVGIIGEGMSFAPEEKKIAAERQDEIARHINIIIVGEMHDSSIQQDSKRAKQK